MAPRTLVLDTHIRESASEIHPEEVAVAHAASIRPDLVEGSREIWRAGSTSFTWSPVKLRRACFFVSAAAAPAVAGFWLATPLWRWLLLGWLCGIVLLIDGVRRRASDDTVVLSVDRHGILDRRLMSRHIEWQEIESIFPVNTDRNHTLDIQLRWPKTTLRQSRWAIRVGAYCQVAYGVPAVTISMLLLNGNISQLLYAVAQHRPDLLHHTNRGALFAAST